MNSLSLLEKEQQSKHEKESLRQEYFTFYCTLLAIEKLVSERKLTLLLGSYPLISCMFLLLTAPFLFHG